MNKVGIFIGHKNYLPHAMLLCKSLSDHFSKEQGLEIYAMTPEHLNVNLCMADVTQVKFDVPPVFRDTPFVDKILAAALFEHNCENGYLWMDVDSLFLKPAEFLKTAELLINPVDTKNIGDTYDDERSILWRILYDYFHIAFTDTFVNTSATQEKIYPYFNMGMIVVNRKRNLFGLTKDAVSDLLKREDIKEILQASDLHSVFLHQAVLTCAVLKLYDYKDIDRLPYGVNYPLHMHAQHGKPIHLDDLVSIRYDSFFEKNEVPAQWRRIFSNIKNQLINTWYY